MKRLMVILMLGILLMSSVIGYAVGDLGEWMYSKDIQYEKDLQYKQIFLDEEIYRYAKGDLSDIRIINDKDEFVPYYIYNRYLSSEEETYREYPSKKILDLMKKNDRHIDFQVIISDSNQDVEANQLSLDIVDSNFLKKINLYGSYDNEKWHLITEDYLYRTSESKKLMVNLDSGYKYEYYRIVFLNELDKLNVQGMELLYNQKEIKYNNFIRRTSGDFEVEIKDKEQQTEVLINNENRLKISKINIISKDNFKRQFTTYVGVEGEDEVFRRISSGEIYQVTLENFVDRKNTINFSRFSPSYINQDKIKIVIDDFDNRPINIEDIEITYYIDKLVFPSEANGSYRLLFGSKVAKRPIYDIVSYQKAIEEVEQEKSSLSSAVKLREDSREEAPKITWLNQQVVLNGVLVLVSILLVIIIFKKTGFKEL